MLDILLCKILKTTGQTYHKLSTFLLRTHNGKQDGLFNKWQQENRSSYVKNEIRLLPQHVYKNQVKMC